MSSDKRPRAAPRDRLLGELLLDAICWRGPTGARAGVAGKNTARPAGSVLMRIGAVSEDNLLQVLGRYWALPLMVPRCRCQTRTCCG